MSLINVSNDLMTINALWRIILRWVYDNDHAKEGDLYVINSNIEKWYNIVKMHNVKLADAFGDVAFEQAVGRRGSVTDEIEYQLVKMSQMLVADEEGKLESKKDTYRTHKIDYRKVLEYRNVFPEMWPTKKDLARAQAYKKINDKENERLLN